MYLLLFFIQINKKMASYTFSLTIGFTCAFSTKEGELLAPSCQGCEEEEPFCYKKNTESRIPDEEEI